MTTLLLYTLATTGALAVIIGLALLAFVFADHIADEYHNGTLFEFHPLRFLRQCRWTKGGRS